jgi:hypothetical protein
VDLPGCGSWSAPLAATGDGELELGSFVLGDVTLPLVRGRSADARVRTVEARGPFVITGDADLLSWGLGFNSRDLATIAPPGQEQSWAMSLGRADGGHLFIGALAAATTVTRIDVEGDDLILRWELGDGVLLGDGGEIYLDPVVVRVGDDRGALWSAWALDVALFQGGKPAPLPPLADRGGRDALASAPVEADIFFVDPSVDLDAPTANDVAEGGFEAGLVMRPLEVTVDDPLVAARPDWWLADDGGPTRVLDVTAEGAGDWLQERVASAVDAGFIALRLEGLDRGLSASPRASGRTPMEAHAEGLRRARRGAGRAWLGVDGPELAAVGAVDADNRIAVFSNRAGDTAAWFLVAPGVALKVPLGQGTGSGAAAVQKNPAGQSLHGASPTVPPVPSL